jgi:eukaryotic-like serine/threonine-protein kinase
MLGDLRKRLEPIGRLDAMDDLGRQVIAYYEAQALGNLDDEALGRRGKALQLLGEVAYARSQSEDALARAGEAVAAATELLARRPTEPQRLIDLAEAKALMALVMGLNAGQVDAEGVYREAIGLAERALELDPGRGESAYALSRIRLDFGDSLAESGRLRAGMDELRQAVRHWPRQLPQDTLHRITWLQLQASLADLGFHQDAYQEALSTSRAVLVELLAWPGTDSQNDVRLQDLLARAWSRHASALAMLGHPTEARDSQQRALALGQAMAAKEPTEVGHRFNVVVDTMRLAELDEALGRRQAARQGLAQAQALYRELTGMVDAGSDLMLFLPGVMLLTEARLLPDAPGLADRMAAAIARLLGNEAAIGRMEQLQVCELHYRLGLQYRRAGREAEARGQWQAALQRLERLDDQQNRQHLPLRGLLHWALGDRAGAARVAESIASGVDRSTDHAALRRALGWQALPPVSVDAALMAVDPQAGSVSRAGLR